MSRLHDEPAVQSRRELPSRKRSRRRSANESGMVSDITRRDFLYTLSVVGAISIEPPPAALAAAVPIQAP
jgi:hypothetical protein